MFSQKKGKADITQTDNHFSVRYAGKVQTYVPNGRGCTQAPVQKIWDCSVEEKDMRRVNLLLNPSGILLKELGNKKGVKETMVDIKDISYCCAEKGAHERIFAWVCMDRSCSSRTLQCHAVVCNSKDEAKQMALVMSRSFQIAYRDWKNNKEKAARQKTSSEKQERTKAGIERSNSQNENMDQKSSTSGSSDLDYLDPEDLDHDDLGDSSYLARAMAQMNIVEEDVISFTENNIVVGALTAETEVRPQE